MLDMKLIFLFLLFGFLIIYGIPLIFKIVRNFTRGPMNKKGRAKLEELRNDAVDVEKILGEMRYLAIVTLEAFDKYWGIENSVMRKTVAIFDGERSRLCAFMEDNVRREWTPRLILLKERQHLFDDNKVLYNAFLDCVKIDKHMQKCTEDELNMMIANKSLRNLVKVGLGVVAVGAIAGIAVVAVTTSMINKGGKDMFTGGPKYDEKWIDRVTGKEYDHNPVNDI